MLGLKVCGVPHWTSAVLLEKVFGKRDFEFVVCFLSGRTFPMPRTLRDTFIHMI